ncbi:hypothetical protein [[Kitasatospora] papulosa]
MSPAAAAHRYTGRPAEGSPGPALLSGGTRNTDSVSTSGFDRRSEDDA